MVQSFRAKTCAVLIASPIRRFFIERKDDDLHSAWPLAHCICKRQNLESNLIRFVLPFYNVHDENMLCLAFLINFNNNRTLLVEVNVLFSP